MIRAVLAIVLTTALLGASLPAIDDARRDHTEATVRTELDQFEQAAARLLATDDPVTGDGARRIVRLTVPAKRWSDAGVDSLTIDGWQNGLAGRITWTPTTGSQRVRRLPDVPLRTPGPGPLTLDTAGTYRLVLSLDGTETRPVVTVRRFTNQEGTTRGHATVAPDAT